MMVPVASALIVLAATAASVHSLPAPGTSKEYASLEALRHYALGRLYDERGEGAEAVGEYYRALALDPHASVIARSISESRSRDGDAQGSLEFAERALAEDPNDAHAMWLKGAALFNLGSAEPALQALEAAVRADSGAIEYVRTLARVAEQLDRLDIVERAYARATELDEDDAESWFQLAAVEARLGKFENARRALETSVQLNPVRPGLYFLQGWIDESLGNEPRAIELYRQHLALHQGDQVTRRRLVNLLAHARRFAEAYQEAYIITQARADDAQSLEVEADLAFYAGRPGDGQRALEALQRLRPDDPRIVDRVIGILGRHDRGADAEGIARRWSLAHPDNFRGSMLAARAALLANHLPAAIEHARHAVALAPDSLESLALLGRVYQGGKRWAQAESVWTSAAGKFPQEAGVALDLAFCREQLGDLDGAERAARDVLARESSNPTALNFLGYLLAEHGRNLEEAESLIRRAVAQEPDNGAFVDSEGWVYFRLGRLEEARTRLERAVTLTGGDPVVHEHLGDVYKSLHFMDLAREQYRLSLAGDGSNSRVRAKLTEAR